MDDCIFCKIVKRETPAAIEKETDNLIVFKDLNPKAPVHFLIVPKEHLADIREASSGLWDEVRRVAVELAKDKNSNSFRLVTNAGSAAYVPHMHVHFLAGITVEREV